MKRLANWTLNPLIQGNPSCLYDLLFKAAAETLRTFGRDPCWIGGEIGITLVLHTWGQNLGQHVHVHGLVTGGGLAPNGNQWQPAKKGFLFPVTALSTVFRSKYLEFLAHAYKKGTLRFGGSTSPLAEDHAFHAFLTELKRAAWVVYAKAPFAGPEQVVSYLGRYTHRVAISNNRIVGLDGDQVWFTWRDYRDGSKIKVMQLEVAEFIRRFLLHVLPAGFLANSHRQAKLGALPPLARPASPWRSVPPAAAPWCRPRSCPDPARAAAAQGSTARDLPIAHDQAAAMPVTPGSGRHLPSPGSAGAVAAANSARQPIRPPGQRQTARLHVPGRPAVRRSRSIANRAKPPTSHQIP